MSRYPRKPVYPPAPASEDGSRRPASAAQPDVKKTLPADQGGELAKPSRFTFYASPETIGYLDELIFFGRKAGQTRIRDRTQIVRALLEAFRQSGHGLGDCRTEDELLHALTKKLRG